MMESADRGFHTAIISTFKDVKKNTNTIKKRIKSAFKKLMKF